MKIRQDEGYKVSKYVSILVSFLSIDLAFSLSPIVHCKYLFLQIIILILKSAEKENEFQRVSSVFWQCLEPYYSLSLVDGRGQSPGI